jgi:hypothetical protein
LIENAPLIEKPKLAEESVVLHGLKFKIAYDEECNSNSLSITYPESYSESEIYTAINKILSDLTSISEKGFIIDKNLKVFPILKEFLTFFTSDLEYIKGSKIMISAKWIYAIILTSLYFLVIERLNKLEGLLEKGTGAVVNEDLSNLRELQDLNEFYSDLQANYLNLQKELHSKLDPSIRKSLQKRGLTVLKNIFTGFDTEYTNIDQKYNELLSVQLSVSSRIVLKIPRNRIYSLSNVHSLSNRDYPLKFDRSKKSPFNFQKVDTILSDLVSSIRLKKYTSYELDIDTILYGLEKLTEMGEMEKIESND